MKRIFIIGLGLLVLGGEIAQAKLNVVATLSDLGQMVEMVGGSDVQVTVLCPGHKDPHYLPAKPSLARKLAKADLLVFNGLELEIGWLPQLIQKARNPKVRPGQAGYLDCSSFVPIVLDIAAGSVDRSQGDIHPLGNPHYTLDPRIMIQVADGIAHRLSELDPDHSGSYEARAGAFSERLRARIPDWEARVDAARRGRVLLYHQTWRYLVNWLDLDVYGEIEHRPGIAPSPKHVQLMIDEGRRQGDVIVIAASWSHEDVARQVAEKIGAPLAVLPAATGADVDAKDYESLIETIVSRISAAADRKVQR